LKPDAESQKRRDANRHSAMPSFSQSSCLFHLQGCAGLLKGLNQSQGQSRTRLATQAPSRASVKGRSMFMGDVLEVFMDLNID